MTNEEVWRIALEQSACDCGCAPEDFGRFEPVITVSRRDPRARKYLPLPFACDMVSYGSNVVAQTREDLMAPVREYLSRYPAAHAFETPHIHALDDLLREYGLKVCFMAEYFLPDVSVLRALECDYELRVLEARELACLNNAEWHNALSRERRELDVLGVGAFDGDKLIGLAACSADCERMWQIGIDVLLDYRKKGIAAALTSRLAIEILERGKVPFYCCAWSNVGSARNAIRSGFRPAWVEMTVKPIETVDSMNK
jgi:hypothetical protein